jgi:hypothetical protein
MAERSYSEQRDSSLKFTRLLGFILLGFTILLFGVGVVYSGLTDQYCSARFLGLGVTCPTTTRIDYSVLGIGIVIMALSLPIFLLSWKAYKRTGRNKDN